MGASGSNGEGTVKEGLRVSLDFELKRGDTGEVMDTTKENGPLAFTVGAFEVFPKLDAGVRGMAVGEEGSIDLGDDSFGQRDEEKIVEFPLEKLPEGVAEGAQLQMQGPQGPMIATVTAVGESMATLDLNHPLAGIPLTMQV